VIGDEPGVEPVDLGLGPDLGGAAAVVGSEHRGKQCRFEDREIVLHRRSRHLAWSRECLSFEETATLREDQLRELHEKRAFCRLRRIREVPRPVGTHPLLVVLVVDARGEEERRQAAL